MILRKPAPGPAFPCAHGWLDLSRPANGPMHPQPQCKGAPMAEEFLNRIRHKDLRARVTSADRAAELIRDGMVLGMSGFTRSGEADRKSVV